jgi:inosine kinase
VRFPGRRNPKHYFPVSRKATRVVPAVTSRPRWYVVGLDEVLVDVEVHGPLGLAHDLGLIPGESVQLSDEDGRRLLDQLAAAGRVRSFTAGGTVANSLNNFTHLSGEPAVLLGCIEDGIRPGSPAFRYVAQSAKAVNLDYLKPVRGPTGFAITFFAEDGERAFGVAPGVSGEFGPEDVPEDLVQGAAMVLASMYSLRPKERPIASAVCRMMELASAADIPVAFGLGTASLVRETRDEVRQILKDHVTIAAMNEAEAEALTGESDALLAGKMVLEWVDAVVITEGPRGLTFCGWTDDRVKRETREMIRSGSIADYNRFEYSRLMKRRDCARPLRIYSHIHPYQGGPDRLSNTSGAGDAALAGILHDVVANAYHRKLVPESPKHHLGSHFLSYSSLSRNARYGNRIAYEVLKGHSPRLDGPLPPDPEDDVP